jgi:hypothetical protein
MLRTMLVKYDSPRLLNVSSSIKVLHRSLREYK